MRINSSTQAHKLIAGAAILTTGMIFSHAAAFADDQPATTPSAAATTPSAAATTPSAAATTPPATAATPPAAATTPPAAATTPGATAPLQGGVQMIELNLQTLRDLGLDLKNVLKAASSLYDEVTIQPVTIMTQPEVVGRGTVINIPIGFMPTGAGPNPNPKRVNMAMNQMRPIITQLKQDMDEFEEGRKRLDISDDERQELHPQFEKWRDGINKVYGDLGKLETLTQKKPYDTNSIAAAAGEIGKNVKEMDETRRKIYKFLQKEGKKKKKNA